MPTPYQFAAESGVHIWRASLDVCDAQLAMAESVLDPAELARARRFHFERDQRRFVLARGLLRRLLARYLDVEPPTVTFAAGPHGKPGLAAPGQSLCFNLSHSGTQVLFAFSAGREVGIDLEAGVRLGDDWPGLSRRIFSPREQTELASVSPEHRRAAFLNGWTRKEAYLKATGQGLVNGLQQIEVTLAPGKPAAFLASELAAKWTLIDLREDHADVAAALVVEGSAASIEIFDAPADL